VRFATPRVLRAEGGPALRECKLVIPRIVLRIVKEEQFLRENLPGYSEYCQKTRYRLLPSLW
jgi:protein-S-isoprenylcysteine O-methyltransferase Ste14